jgi:hypothetical protein
LPPPDVIGLFDEFASRHARGEAPDVRAYLDRAGDAREELADLVDRYLASAVPGEPDEALVRAFAAWAAGEPPLLALRVERGVRRDEIVDAILGRFRLAQGTRAKVGRYVHRLETGLLDPRPVDPGVFDAWAGVLGAGVRDLLAWRPPAVERSAAYLRADEAVASLSVPAPAEERDEVDDLFTGRG